MKIINLFLMSILCVSFLSAQEHDVLSSQQMEYLRNKKEIKVCIDPVWMPFEALYDNEVIGMTSDYLRLLQKDLVIPFKLVPTKSWTQSLEYIKQRKCDILSLAVQTSDRKIYMSITKPYLILPLVIATKLDKLFISNIEEILDKKIGTTEGYAYFDLLEVKYPKLKTIKYPDITEGLKAVAQDEIYGFIDNPASIGYLIQREHTGILKIAGKIDENWDLSIAVRNDEPELLKIFDILLSKISISEKQKIFSKWVSVKYDQKPDYTLIIQVIIGFILVIIFLLYRYKSMKNNSIEMKEKLEIIKKLSKTDQLTKLYNRHFIDESFKSEIQRSKRYTSIFSIILIDIDFFKKVNDTYGHEVGDKLLVKIAFTLKTHIRESDILGRWGGEEFLIICPQSSSVDAKVLAEKLRVEITLLKCADMPSQSCSFGISQYRTTDSDQHNVIKRADDALYKAKKQGRNRVVLID